MGLTAGIYAPFVMGPSGIWVRAKNGAGKFYKAKPLYLAQRSYGKWVRNDPNKRTLRRLSQREVTEEQCSTSASQELSPSPS